MKKLALMALLATASAAHADSDAGLYAIGARMEYGTTYLPAGADAGMSNFISYRDWNGIVSTIVTLLLPASTASPDPKTSTSVETICAGGGNTSCGLYEVTRTTYPTRAELDAYDAGMRQWDNIASAMQRGELGRDIQIDVASTAFGGTTSGAMMHLYHPLGDLGRYTSLGVSFGYLRFHDIHSKKVVAVNGTLSTMEVVSDHTFGLAGLPLRVQVPLGGGFTAHAVWEANVMALFFDDQSPLRAGFEWSGSHVVLSAEAQTSGFSAQGRSLNVGAWFAF